MSLIELPDRWFLNAWYTQACFLCWENHFLIWTCFQLFVYAHKCACIMNPTLSIFPFPMFNFVYPLTMWSKISVVVNLAFWVHVSFAQLMLIYTLGVYAKYLACSVLLWESLVWTIFLIKSAVVLNLCGLCVIYNKNPDNYLWTLSRESHSVFWFWQGWKAIRIPQLWVT